MLSPERRDVPQQPIRDPARKCSITRSSYAVFQMLMHEISRLEYAQGLILLANWLETRTLLHAQI